MQTIIEPHSGNTTPSALAGIEQPKRGRGRPRIGRLSIKECRQRIKALGAKPYGKECLKLSALELNLYVERLEGAAH
jgi:hypothetical protein